MTEPVTNGMYLITPNTGDLTGAWGTSALNPDFVNIDAKFCGTTTISLSSATTILLTTLSTSGIATTTVPQSNNAMISFTGAQTGNAIIQFTVPGYYVINNQCTGTSYVQLSPASGTGNSIGAPPGEKCHVFFDGIHMDYVNIGRVGSYLDIAVSTTPKWMTACTVAPYLVCNGSTYSTASYTALGNSLGSTFGGNGITTFGVPDLLNRFRLPLDTSGSAGRVTSAISGVNGTTLGSSGGDQRLQSHTHTNTLTDPGHTHQINATLGVANNAQSGSGIIVSNGTSNTNSNTTGITITNANVGTGTAQNMPPCLVAGITFIKT